MEKDIYDDSCTSTPISETPPLYTRTWGNDIALDRSNKRWKLKTHNSWTSTYSNAAQRTKSTLDTTWRRSRAQTQKTSWKKWKRWIPASWKKHVYAFLLVVVFGVVPLVLLGHYTPQGAWEDMRPGHMPFHGIFQDKVLSCGSWGNRPENATIHGIENLFVLDMTFGTYTFSQVKMIDVAWDVLLGRSVQLIAWWAGYIVFSDALLRAIERHPASFQLFQRIALEGPSMFSLWTLVKELWCARSKRTRTLFVFIWASTAYIMCIQMLLGAMTGYDSTSIAFVSLDDNNNIVPVSAVKRAVSVSGDWRGTFKEPACLDDSWTVPFYRAWDARATYCDCQYKNGTIAEPGPDRTLYDHLNYNQPLCRFNFPGNNQTFREIRKHADPNSYNQEYPCAHAFNVTVNDKAYESLDLNFTSGYCYGNRAYEYMDLFSRTRCLPDTSNPSYRWGFSTMLSGLFVFIHTTWCLTMYVVWLDAQLFSTLVKGGYKMTPLRAAFAIAKAAKRKTGMGEKALVRADTREIEQELYGDRRSKREGMKMEFGMFDEGDEEHEDVEVFRRRVRRMRDESEEDEG